MNYACINELFWHKKRLPEDSLFLFTYRKLLAESLYSRLLSLGTFVQ